ncbi:MAG: cell wall-binding repeat-containing protein [Herbiconiux sp.]|nr:cell wall-binding repeat-containing protein [Herbiconiux sp.]
MRQGAAASGEITMNGIAASTRRIRITALAVAIALLGALGPTASPAASAASLTEADSGATGVIAGTVTLGTPDGSAAAAVPVTLYRWSPEGDYEVYDTPLASKTTSATGEYSFGQVGPGTYQVLAGPTGDLAFAPSYLDDISLASGGSVTADAVLPPAATVSGTLVDPRLGPLADTEIFAFPSPRGHRLLVATTTDASGAFTLTGLAGGDYRAYAFADGTQGLDTVFSVATGATVTGLQLTMRSIASVSGRVTDANDSTLGLAGIQVVFEMPHSNQLTTTTADDGTWAIDIPSSAEGKVRFQDPANRYLPQWWDRATSAQQAKNVNVQQYQQVTGIDGRLELGSSISGQVLSAVGLKPYRGLTVGAGGASGVTDADGRYTISPVAPGTYDVFFSADRSHVSKTIKGVTVREGKVTTGVDAVLDRKPSIVGTVSIESPGTIDPTQVSVQLTPVVRWTRPDANGSFHFDDLNPGSYQLRFIPGDRNAYFTTWWKDALRVEDATSIDLVLNQQPEVIDAVVPLRTRPDTTRVGGANRYAVSAAVAQKGFGGPGGGVVYVATGEGFADALSAGGAAVVQNAPLLLTQKDQLPASVKAQITNLAPKTIVVVGGPNSVSPAVLTQLKAIQPNTVRIGGTDRYDASRGLARYAFGSSGAQTAYIATGTNFPDALAAGGAAGDSGAPVILVDGSAGTLDAATRTLLDELGVERVVIAGGTGTVSTGIEKALQSIGAVERQAGADRYETAVKVNLAAYSSSAQAFLVTGEKFPDALSGSAWAGHLAAPLYVSPGSCVPDEVLAALESQDVTTVTLIGGPNSLSRSVLDLEACPLP